MTAVGGLQYQTYRADGTDEWLMRMGPLDATPVLILPPLFEEMNRSRAFLAAVMRGLAAAGLGCWLPDLPGTGESETPLAACGWDVWKEAVAAAADHICRSVGQRPMAVSVRGGCLLDGQSAAAGWWRLAPVAGASLVRDLERSGLAGGVPLAGYRPSPGLLADLAAALPADAAPLRTVRLASDPKAADAKLQGPALWRRSEPGRADALAEIAAADIAAWSRSCVV